MKKSISRYIIIKLFKTRDKEKLLKASREKQICYIQRNKDNNENRFLIEKNSSEMIEMIPLKNCTKKIVNIKFCNKKNLSKMKAPY